MFCVSLVLLPLWAGTHPEELGTLTSAAHVQCVGKVKSEGAVTETPDS